MTEPAKVPGLYIYRQDWQPYSDFIIGCDPDMRIRHAPRTLHRCDECMDRRQARNLEVQAYYDQIYVRCKGGKHPGWN